MGSSIDNKPELVLPCAVFRSKVTWKWYEVFNLTYFRFACLLLTVVLVARRLPISETMIGAFMMYILSLSLISKIWPRLKKKALFNRRDLLNELYLIVDPEFDDMKWRELTVQINKVLFEKGYWNTRYCLYESSECRGIFEKYILENGTKASDRFKQIVEELFKSNLEEHPLLLGSLLKDDHLGNSFIKGESIAKIFSIILCTFLTVLLKSYQLKSVTGISLLYELISFPKFIKTRHLPKYGLLRVSDKVKYLATIMQIAPRDDMEKWDQVAKCMNYYLCAVSIWRMPQEKFFDGMECRNFYKSQFEPLAVGEKEKSGFEFAGIVRETNKVCGTI